VPVNARLYITRQTDFNQTLTNLIDKWEKMEETGRKNRLFSGNSLATEENLHEMKGGGEIRSKKVTYSKW
jgi:hypothetical protein